MVNDELLGNLKKAILGYDGEKALHLVKKIVEKNIDPSKTLEAATEAMREIGDGFSKGELWLPDLIGAADAMQTAMPAIQEGFRGKGMKMETLGVVVAGTVYGDIHSIGKTMVCTLLTADGFTVYDIGVNITAERFVEAVKNYEADILAMSALMTTTAVEQEKVIAILKKENLRDKVKIIVGGAAVTEKFAQNIGADGYDPTAVGAVKLARSLVGK